MSKNTISFSSLKLKQKEDVKTIPYTEDKIIEVKQYISSEDKEDLIQAVLQNSLEDRIYNPFKIDMYFHLYLVFLYSNISFTDKQKTELNKTYDLLESNGLIDLVVEQIPDREYVSLLKHIDRYMQLQLEYNTTAAAIIESLINELPKNAKEAADILKQIDPSAIQNVIDFAKSVNGGREIK